MGAWYRVADVPEITSPNRYQVPTVMAGPVIATDPPPPHTSIVTPSTSVPNHSRFPEETVTKMSALALVSVEIIAQQVRLSVDPGSPVVAVYFEVEVPLNRTAIGQPPA